MNAPIRESGKIHSPPDMQRLAATFFSADGPPWSPDGQHVLFLGAADDKKPVADRYNWWVAPIAGGAPVPTGALAAPRAHGVAPGWREPGDWIDHSDRIRCVHGSIRDGLSTGLINQSSIWSVRLASNPWRIDGEPQQLTHRLRRRGATFRGACPLLRLSFRPHAVLQLPGGGRPPAVFLVRRARIATARCTAGPAMRRK